MMSSVTKMDNNMTKRTKVVMHTTMAIQDEVSMVMNSVTKVEMKVVIHVTMAIEGDKVSMVMSSATKVEMKVVMHMTMAIQRD
jgi:intracellular sulfur oxidation DsrE/DsrF family protein